MATIYKIRNAVNGKLYVGKTVCSLQERFRLHVSAARCGTDTFLYRAMRKHGAGAFTITELESVPAESIDEAERRWIKELCAANPKAGYNLTLGGDGVRPNPATRKRMASGQRTAWAEGKYKGRKPRPKLTEQQRANISKGIAKAWKDGTFKGRKSRWRVVDERNG